jgi:hypothetical protein
MLGVVGVGESLYHVGLILPRRRCHFARVCLAPQRLREPTLFVKCGSAQILHPPWDSDRPAVITKKMLKLTTNDGTGIRDKPDAAFRPKPIHGCDETDGACLHQILFGEPARPKRACDVAHKRLTAQDQRLAGGGITGPGPCHERFVAGVLERRNEVNAFGV